MPFQSLHKPFTLTILIGLVNEGLKTLFDEGAPLRINLWTERLDAQTQGVFDNPFELLAEVPPLRSSVEDTGTDQVSEKMDETPLFQKGTDLVVGPEEVADQHPLKELSQDFFEDRRGPGGGNQVISDFALFTGEAPKPVGFA